MYICHIIPIQKGIPFDVLSYFSNDPVRSGTIVSIKIGSTSRFGIVLDSTLLLAEKSSLKNATFSLKKIERVLFYSEQFSAAIEAIVKVQNKTLAPLGTIANAVLSQKHLEQLLKLYGEKKEMLTAHQAKSPIKNSFRSFPGTTAERYKEYRQLVRKNLAAHQSVLIVVPTIHDAEALEVEIGKGIAQHVVTLHSKQKASAMSKLIARALDETNTIVVIATPAFSFIPRNDVSLIIIEKESSDSYTSNDRFSIDTRLFFTFFAEMLHIDVVASDIVPRFETWETFDHDRFPAVRNSDTLQLQAPLPEKNSYFSKEIDMLIDGAIAKEQTIFIYSHRRGLAPISRCHDCGTVVTCPQCSLPLVLKQTKDGETGELVRAFVCNHCGHIESASEPCIACRSWNISPLAIGTESIAEALRAKYTNIDIVILEDIKEKLIDTNGISKKETKRKGTKIYVGTEQLLAYISDIDYCVLPFFDRLLSTPSYETIEKALRVVLSCLESAKRQTLVSTKNVIPFFDYIAKGMVERLITEELKLRKQFGFPPFGVFLKVSMSAAIGIATQVFESCESVFERRTIKALSLQAHRSRTTNAVTKSWILLADDSWIEREGTELIAALTVIKSTVSIERNPHYFS